MMIFPFVPLFPFVPSSLPDYSITELHFVPTILPGLSESTIVTT
jgi:hypothetical protein